MSIQYLSLCHDISLQYLAVLPGKCAGSRYIPFCISILSRYINQPVMNSEIIIFGIQSSSKQDLLTCCHTSNITVFGFATPILAPWRHSRLSIFCVKSLVVFIWLSTFIRNLIWDTSKFLNVF